eukprot:6126706-Prymnesium_polylepis.1
MDIAGFDCLGAEGLALIVSGRDPGKESAGAPTPRHDARLARSSGRPARSWLGGGNDRAERTDENHPTSGQPSLSRPGPGPASHALGARPVAATVARVSVSVRIVVPRAHPKGTGLVWIEESGSVNCVQA